MSDKISYSATISAIVLAFISTLSIVVACSKELVSDQAPDIELATTIVAEPLRFEDLYEGDKFMYNGHTYVKLRPVFLAGDEGYPVNAFCPSLSYYVTFGNREKLDWFVGSN